MNTKTLLQVPRLSRAVGVAVMTALITSLAFYSIFLETDYGRALFFTYDKLWEAAQQHESSGNLREAESLIRHIVATEEDRATLKFGVGALMFGPGDLIHAKLKLAELHWRQRRLLDADASYRDALVTVASLSGTIHWRYAVARFRYAEFLAATARIEEARQQLALTEELIRAIYLKWTEDGGPFWEEDEEANRRPVLEDLSRKISALRDRHAAM